MTERTYTTAQAAAELNVPERRIIAWRMRGRVRPVDAIAGRGRGGVVPLYNLEDLRPLAAEYHGRQDTTRRQEG